MSEHKKFNMQINALIELALQGADYEQYCKEHGLEWFAPQLEIISKAYTTGVFLKEDIKILLLRAESLSACLAELKALTNKTQTIMTPIKAVVSRRRLH
ncbi:hypothetical protein RCJ22_20265 [Vibrio sp. FNV 38]|nr:hypothetical protein [Vibrio sp. FNV 38]